MSFKKPEDCLKNYEKTKKGAQAVLKKKVIIRLSRSLQILFLPYFTRFPCMFAHVSTSHRTYFPFFLVYWKRNGGWF